MAKSAILTRSPVGDSLMRQFLHGEGRGSEISVNAIIAKVETRNMGQSRKLICDRLVWSSGCFPQINTRSVWYTYSMYWLSQLRRVEGRRKNFAGNILRREPRRATQVVRGTQTTRTERLPNSKFMSPKASPVVQANFSDLP